MAQRPAAGAGLRMLQVADALARAGRHGLAALAYAAVTKASPAVSPCVHAVALYRSAKHAVAAATAADGEQREEYFARARASAQKCALVLRGQPGSFFMRMQVCAVLEAVYSGLSDFGNAEKVVSAALLDLGESGDEPAASWSWWLYFKSSALRNYMLEGGLRSFEMAMRLCGEAGSECVRVGEPLSAVAFYLVHAQIALCAPRRETASQSDACPLLEQANLLIVSLPGAVEDPGKTTDRHLLRVYLHALQSLSLIRLGHLGDAREHCIPKMVHALEDALRHESRQGASHGQWRWLPSSVVRSLSHHIQACAHMSLGGGQDSWRYAVQALADVGLDVRVQSSLCSASLSCDGKLSKRASFALIVALLESAIRIKLSLLNFLEASQLILAIMSKLFEFAPESRTAALLSDAGQYADPSQLIASNHALASIGTQCAAYLLCAEYHILRGRVSSAQVAAQYLTAIVQRTGSGGDVLQMARSYYALLSGEERDGLIGIAPIAGQSGAVLSGDIVQAGAPSSPFYSKQVQAVALFAIGVHNMRVSRVLDARYALQMAVCILGQFSGQNPMNEQVLSNTMSVLSGLFLTHEEITQDAVDMTTAAVNLADSICDPVTLARATKQRFRLNSRLDLSFEMRSQSRENMEQAARSLTLMQSRDVPEVLHCPDGSRAR